MSPLDLAAHIELHGTPRFTEADVSTSCCTECRRNTARALQCLDAYDEAERIRERIAAIADSKPWALT